MLTASELLAIVALIDQLFSVARGRRFALAAPSLDFPPSVRELRSWWPHLKKGTIIFINGFIRRIAGISQDVRSEMTEPFLSALAARIDEKDPARVALCFLILPTSAGALPWFFEHNADS